MRPGNQHPGRRPGDPSGRHRPADQRRVGPPHAGTPPPPPHTVQLAAQLDGTPTNDQYGTRTFLAGPQAQKPTPQHPADPFLGRSSRGARTGRATSPCTFTQLEQSGGVRLCGGRGPPRHPGRVAALLPIADPATVYTLSLGLIGAVHSAWGWRPADRTGPGDWPAVHYEPLPATPPTHRDPFRCPCPPGRPQRAGTARAAAMMVTPAAVASVPGWRPAAPSRDGLKPGGVVFTPGGHGVPTCLGADRDGSPAPAWALEPRRRHRAELPHRHSCS